MVTKVGKSCMTHRWWWPSECESKLLRLCFTSGESEAQVPSVRQMKSICRLISWLVSSTWRGIHHWPRAAAHRIEWSLSYCAYCWHANRWRSSCARAFQPAANVHLSAPSPELVDEYDGSHGGAPSPLVSAALRCRPAQARHSFKWVFMHERLPNALRKYEWG